MPTWTFSWIPALIIAHPDQKLTPYCLHIIFIHDTLSPNQYQHDQGVNYLLYLQDLRGHLPIIFIYFLSI